MRRSRRIAAALICSAALLYGCTAAIDYARGIYVRLDSSLLGPQITITLNNSFIDTYRDRTAMNVRLIVDRSQSGPKPAFLDGDYHFAGRIAEIGLPVVAEIKNSKSEMEAIDEVREHTGTGLPIRVSGAWRLWFEHAGEGDEVQGEQVPVVRQTNPAHVFEVHPVTKVQDQKTLDSFKPVEGYHPGDAGDAFANFERTSCTIIPGKDKTSIVTQKGEYNDVEFMMEIIGQQIPVQDGLFVDAAVRDLNGKLLVKRVRMVFVKNTKPESIVRRLGPGDMLHVFGLPRLDLAAIAQHRDREKSEANPEQHSITLPYEIVIVGVYGYNKITPRKIGILRGAPGARG